MKRFYRPSIVLAILLSALPLLAEEWSDVLREAEARCQAQAASVRDMTMEQTMVAYTESGEITARQTVYTKGPLSRMDMAMKLPEGAGLDSMNTVLISNGKQAWEISSLTGRRDADPNENMDFLKACWNFTPENSKLIGEDSFEGKPCHLVELRSDSVVHKLWLEKATLRVLQGESRGQDGATARWVLSDFRDVAGGYSRPYEVKIYVDADLVMKMTVTSVLANSGIDDQLFDPDDVQLPSVDIEELLLRAMQSQGSPFGDDSLDVDSLGGEPQE